MPPNNNDLNSPYHELSNKELERGYWFIAHKIFLKRLAYFIIGFAGIALAIFNAYNLIDYYTFENREYEAAMKYLYEQEIDYAGLNLARAPFDLQIGQVEILDSGLKTGDMKYNLLSQVYNPNEKFRINFSYQFSINGAPLNKYESFILPKQKKILVDFKTNIRGTESAGIVLNDLHYERISPRITPDPAGFVSEHLDFSVKKFQLIPIEAKNKYSKLKFDLVNNSPYEYWETGLFIIISKNNKIIGAEYFKINEAASRKPIPVEMNWYEHIPSSVNISIFPDIDVFDPTVYKKLEGEQKGIAL